MLSAEVLYRSENSYGSFVFLLKKESIAEIHKAASKQTARPLKLRPWCWPEHVSWLVETKDRISAETFHTSCKAWQWEGDDLGLIFRPGYSVAMESTTNPFISLLIIQEPNVRPSVQQLEPGKSWVLQLSRWVGDRIQTQEGIVQRCFI